MGVVKSAVIEGRVDVKTSAELARYFTEKGFMPTSKSDLVWKVFEALRQVLVQNEVLSVFDSTQEALDYLRSLNLASIANSGDSVRKGILQAIQQEALQADFGTDVYAQAQRRTKSGIVAPEAVRQAIEVMERKIKDGA